jgi:uncharacterized protein YggU (UPF0235/DUF167 family)
VAAVRVLIRAKPGAAATRVGGRHPGPRGDALVVSVQARAVEGAANEAVVDALARAFGVRRRDVSIVAGATSRDKMVEVEGEHVAATLARLLGAAD